MIITDDYCWLWNGDIEIDRKNEFTSFYIQFYLPAKEKEPTIAITIRLGIDNYMWTLQNKLGGKFLSDLHPFFQVLIEI